MDVRGGMYKCCLFLGFHTPCYIAFIALGETSAAILRSPTADMSALRLRKRIQKHHGSIII